MKPRSEALLESIHEVSSSINESGMSWSEGKSPHAVPPGAILEFDAEHYGKFKLAILRGKKGSLYKGSEKYAYVSEDKKIFTDGMYSGGVTGGGIDRPMSFDRSDEFEFIKFV